MTERNRLLSAEDHLVVRAGLGGGLKSQPGFEVVVEPTGRSHSREAAG